MARIHWLGAGLSSVPGIRRLITLKQTLTLWNRTVSKAEAAVAGLSGDFDVKAFTMDALAETVAAGDIVVSMLPATMHLEVANLCLDNDCHFVSSSYISPEMAALDQRAKEKGLVFVNEVGLDPGLDHLLAHLLMADYKQSPAFDKENSHEFRSFCGGFPAVANDFRYKFSWSPLGVLKALKSPAQAIIDGKIVKTEKPWDAIADFQVALPGGSETFQSYPNRDSLPFMQDYGFGQDWTMDTFVRGTLRLDGWSDAWADIFSFVEKDVSGPDGEQKLADLSAALWDKHSYDEGEADRVVLVVDMKVSKNGEPVWHKCYAMDARGNADHSAMARLVSLPVSLAIEAITSNRLASGVQAAPSDEAIITDWLNELKSYGDEANLSVYAG